MPFWSTCLHRSAAWFPVSCHKVLSIVLSRSDVYINICSARIKLLFCSFDDRLRISLSKCFIYYVLISDILLSPFSISNQIENAQIVFSILQSRLLILLLQIPNCQVIILHFRFCFYNKTFCFFHKSNFFCQFFRSNIFTMTCPYRHFSSYERFLRQLPNSLLAHEVPLRS